MLQDIMNLLDPERATTLVVTWIPQLVAGLLVFMAFWLLTRVTRPPFRSTLLSADFDEHLVDLLVDSLYKYAILLVGLIMALSQLGIDVAAALAGLGVAGVALGFAAQDAVANTIAGFFIFWDKPFEVGHFIETQGRYGRVTEITMRTTRIRTPNNTYVVIPNQEIADGVLVNHSMLGEIRVDVPVGIGYGENVDEARRILLDVAGSMEGVAANPEPAVVVSELGGSSVNLEVRVWVQEAGNEKAVFVRGLERFKAALEDAGVEIPYPHIQLQIDQVEDSIWDRVEGLPSLARARGE